MTHRSTSERDSRFEQGATRANPAARRPPVLCDALERRVLLAAAPSVTSFTLINADTDKPIAAFAPLAGGAVLNLGTLPTTHLNVRANVSGAAGSVKFGYDARSSYRIDNSSPFALGGNSGGDYFAWTPAVGSHTIKATAYSLKNATGTAGKALSVAIKVVSQPWTVAASQVDTTGLHLTWAPPVGVSGIAGYQITYTPGIYIPGSAGSTQTTQADAAATSADLTALAPFTLYSIDVKAVNAAGSVLSTSHVNAWTAAPATQQRYLYVVQLPNANQGFTALAPQIQVFDINNNNQWVKNIPLPSGIYFVRGVAANALTGRLYIDYLSSPPFGGPGGLLCLDLNTNAVIWKRDYDASVVHMPDRFALTPDGTKIYMPFGENAATDNWVVIDAMTGDPIGNIRAANGPHNTLISLDGRYVFMEGVENLSVPGIAHTVAVVDTTTDKVVRRVGPFQNIVRPFTINGKATRVFATLASFVGFQVADVATGKVLYTAAPPNYTQPKPPPHETFSHGIALTPDEKEVWVVDSSRVGIHVWDVSGLPGKAPKYIGFIKTRATGKDLSGNPDPAAASDATMVPGWIIPSYDGKYMYAESGEVIDVATHKVIGQLRGKTLDANGNLMDGPYTHSRFMLEVDFDGGQAVRVDDQFGVGRVR